MEITNYTPTQPVKKHMIGEKAIKIICIEQEEKQSGDRLFLNTTTSFTRGTNCFVNTDDKTAIR